jgi:hypothetical protein
MYSILGDRKIVMDTTLEEYGPLRLRATAVLSAAATDRPLDDYHHQVVGEDRIRGVSVQGGRSDTGQGPLAKSIDATRIGLALPQWLSPFLWSWPPRGDGPQNHPSPERTLTYFIVTFVGQHGLPVDATRSRWWYHHEEHSHGQYQNDPNRSRRPVRLVVPPISLLS